MSINGINGCTFNVVMLPRTTMELPQPVEESALTDDFVINMIETMEEGNDLPTIDYDVIKLVSAEYTDLVPVGTEYHDGNVAATTVVSSERQFPGSSSPVPSPSLFESSQFSPVSSLFESSQFSPVSSPESLSLFVLESPGGSQSSNENITHVVSPSEVLSEQKKAPTGKKRGRKPKSEKALHEILSQQKKQRKIKVYEINKPFADKEKERKRLNAVNAKRHRDLQKEARENLEKQLQEVKTERDNLKKEVESLRAREAKMNHQLEQFKQYLRDQQNANLGFLETTSTF